MTNEQLKQKLMAERNHLEWLRNPDFWMYWPQQPVKRYNKPGEFPQCGTVTVDDKGVCIPVVHDCLMFGDAVNKQPHVCFEYESIEAMLADGWEVD